MPNASHRAAYPCGRAAGTDFFWCRQTAPPTSLVTPPEEERHYPYYPYYPYPYPHPMNPVKAKKRGVDVDEAARAAVEADILQKEARETDGTSRRRTRS